MLMFAANTVPTTFTVGSTLGTGTTLELNGGTTGNDNSTSRRAADNVTVNTGNGKNNAVNITNAGDLSGHPIRRHRPRRIRSKLVGSQQLGRQPCAGDADKHSRSPDGPASDRIYRSPGGAGPHLTWSDAAGLPRAE